MWNQIANQTTGLAKRDAATAVAETIKSLKMFIYQINNNTYWEWKYIYQNKVQISFKKSFTLNIIKPLLSCVPQFSWHFVVYWALDDEEDWLNIII